MALVTDDEEGNEVEVARPEIRAKAGSPTSRSRRRLRRRARRDSRRRASRSRRRGAARSSAAASSAALIFILVVFVMPSGGSRGASIAMGVLYAVAFIPLTYWIDRLTYRTWQRRQAKS